jgi:hypothetical protein
MKEGEEEEVEKSQTLSKVIIERLSIFSPE